MKKTNRFVFLCALILLLLTFTGCGHDSDNPVLINGVVEDGPVGDSTISLYDKEKVLLSLCGEQGTARCETKTDATGSFSLLVKAGTDLAELNAVAVGVDFIGPELSAPLGLFADNLNEVVITPLTTLVAKLRDHDLSLSASQDDILDWLFLPPATNLSIRPSLSPEVERNDLLLSKVALEINAKTSGAQPFDLIAAEIFNSRSRFFASDGTTCNSEVMTALGLDANAQKRVELLIGSQPLCRVVSPLLLTELSGSDNQQRAAYFYGSDLSPHFRAEQLMWRIYDDAINDTVMLKIVEGKVNAGLLDQKTWDFIDDKFVQPNGESKGHAYLALAKALIKFNQSSEESLRALDKARDIYNTIIESKGKASAAGSDVFNLLETSRYYREAGNLAAAQSLLTDIAAIAEALNTDATAYGRLITGYKRVADAYISAGNLDAAALLVDEMYDYSLQTPADPITFKLRLLNLSECAKRYADLGNQPKVLEIFTKIQELRKIVNSAEATFWTPVITLVESLYRVGEAPQALALANTLPSNQTSAFKLVATYEALQGNLETAFSIVDNTTYFPKVEDKIELLTYFSNTRHYIGLKLINAGRFAEARQALEKAENLLDSMTASNNLVRISNGYVKVAELYALMGDKTKAVELLQRAEGAISADIYRVTVMVDIALGYHNLTQTSVALDLLDNAQGLADVDPTLYRAEIYPNLGKEEYATRLYEKLVKAYEKIGEKSRVRTTIVNSFQPWAEKIHTTNTVNDSLAGKECDYLLKAAGYLDRAGDHAEALQSLALAEENAVQIAIDATRLGKYLGIIATYTAAHEYEKALELALSLGYTSERNQAIQSLANAYIDRDDFPQSLVASIDSDRDGKPDFFNPLVSSEEIVTSGLFLDDDSDGDGIIDTLDLRPLFAD